MTGEAALYRRGETVALLPRGSALHAIDIAVGVDRPLTPRAAAILTALDGWTTVGQVVARSGGLSRPAVRATLASLHAVGLVERSGDATDPRRQALRQWRGWLPEAGLFHFLTRGGTHVPLEAVVDALEGRLLLGDRPPDAVSSGRGRPTRRLPAARRSGALPNALLARRSWRRFGRRAITRQELATLLQLTWGVQRWMHPRPQLRAALKTSPSGGACHALEVYVVAERVRGLARGVYRYQPDTHALVEMRRGLPPGAVVRGLRQPWFAGSGATFVITAAWRRVQWKYPTSRAYRTVLIEAGHFGQTFCLVATWLDLAPYCTAAFDDVRIERLLRVDGVRESAIYVTGVGSRPAGAQWAPWPDDARIPPTSPPAWARTRGRSA